MTRARHVTPARTIGRIQKLCTLVDALRAGRLYRDEIGAILSVGPSGVRKYLADLCDKVELVSDSTGQACRWAASEEETREFLASLAAEGAARAATASKTSLSVAARDPSRHIHIMNDDVEFKVRLQRGIPAPDPVLAHFFNRVPAGLWA